MGHVSDGVKTPAIVNVVEPYDFALSLRAIRSFEPTATESEPRLRLAVRLGKKPSIIEVTLHDTQMLTAISHPVSDPERVGGIVEWVLFTELDLKPFYRLLSDKPNLAWLTKKLYGLKPYRPTSLFEMAVTAITEQQISLAAAYKIRKRVVERFGEPVEDLWVFPEPEALAKASLDDLRACGLSRQKSDYIKALAEKIAGGELNLEGLKNIDTDKARGTILNIKGFGRWSADYILIRGLARPDCVPVDDLGIRTVIGKLLGKGARPSAEEAEAMLKPYKPYRGLMAFYFLAAWRLKINPD